MIPLFSPLRQNEAILSELENRMAQVIRSGEYILGPEVDEFEKNICHRLDFTHAVACSSGTEALILSLKALDLGAGAEVITPAFSFVASANAIVWAGMTPIFADVSLDTACISVETLERVLTPKTRAVIAVDLYGRQSEITQLKNFCQQHHLFLIEDGAQSIGVPNLGPHLYTTSFYPTKNVGAIGDAGAVLTDDLALATRVRELSRHGGLLRDDYPRVGTTARMDSLQAAILNVKLKSLESWTQQRRALATKYLDAFESLEREGKVVLPKDCESRHVWSLFTVRIPNGRNLVAELLRSQQIGCGIYYPRTLPKQKALELFSTRECPNAEKLCREVLSLPLYPELSARESDYIVRVFSECLQKTSI